MDKRSVAKASEIFISADGYFAELVKKGMESRRMTPDQEIESYLVSLLNFYLDARNLFDEENPSGPRKPKTFAELYLVAQNAGPTERIELLKRIGDRTLYISGFFADSLERKVIDVDYYADMGCVAYGTLAQYTNESVARVYNVFSSRFLQFVDVLGYISQSVQIQNSQNILRLYDRYIKTGSELAREKLMEIGIVTLPRDQTKSNKQQ